MTVADPQPNDLMGLTPAEYDTVVSILQRPPTHTELGIFSVMWSEHCSYKSSRIWLSQLPTEGPQVICGPGENAGIIDIGDGDAVVFKIESHNHPSFIEPYQGAATGVGGIMRDVFTMGARPVANLNALRFGEPGHPKTRHLVRGVVAGIGGYGNCIGVPTVGGEVNFHPAYNGNILVNAMTVGLARTDKIFYAAAAGTDLPVVYVGSKTGLDGIHGATMASAEFGDDTEQKRPTVQVGDPFAEKLLLEACLELMATDAIIAIQDMGAAGLTSSSVEMASKGGVGIDMDLDKVPLREPGMSAYEIMLSESQERMLMVLKPGHEDAAAAIFAKWDLDFAIIGVTTPSQRLVVRRQGEVTADIPVPPLVSEAPEYRRPWQATPARAVVSANDLPAGDIGTSLLTLLACPDVASRRWIWQQYDHTIMGDTVRGPGGDAALVRVHDSQKGLALTTDCTPRYVEADPTQGARQAVAECWRNITATGAQPLAITNNLNFGNPERPDVMGQFVGAIKGMADACRALDFPVVSGNVSLYNETDGSAILPTPVIGGVGLLSDIESAVTIAWPTDTRLTLVVVGATAGWLGSSLYLREICGREDGAPPPVDLPVERRNGDFVRAEIAAGRVAACHDISDGGLLVAVSEMALAAGSGATLDPVPGQVPPHAWYFGEDQARYVVATRNAEALLAAAKDAAVPAAIVGTTGGDALTLPDSDPISVAELALVHDSWLPDFMDQT